MTRRALGVVFVLSVGLLQALGYVLHNDTLRGLGIVSVASPLPLVFTDRNGFEDFASRFDLRLVGTDGVVREHTLTASDFSQVGGPFNRRAPYAAAIAYAPRLPRRSTRPILHYAFCKTNLLAGVWPGGGHPRDVTLTVMTRTRGRAGVWMFRTECEDE
jgi:hypothetical protein